MDVPLDTASRSERHVSPLFSERLWNNPPQRSRRRERSQTPPQDPKDPSEVFPVDKARLVQQDDLVTRQTFEAKDMAMESLKTEASKLLKEKNEIIHALQAEVRNPLIYL